MRLKPAALAQGALLSAVSLLLTCALLEGAFRCFAIRHLPLRVQACLPKALRILAQTSKDGVLPRDYTAIVGDSYAEGAGDWYDEAGAWSGAPFGSQHVLHALTGRDFIVLAGSGNGSLGGMARTPLDYFAALSAISEPLPAPKAILVYFYEGNDLDDNLREASSELQLPSGDPRLRDAARLSKLLKAKLAGGLFRGTPSTDWRDRLFLLSLARNILGGDLPKRENGEPPNSGAVNRAVAGGREIAIPDGLQGPSMELSRERTDASVAVFEQSLLCLRSRFPSAAVTIVYIPSPLSCYGLRSQNVSLETYWGGAKLRPARDVAARSDLNAAKIAAAAKRQGASFIDARPDVRSAAQNEMVHGPRDWSHFNRKGYTALAEAVARSLR